MYSNKDLANTYKKLEARAPPPDQEFCIYAYFLYTQPKDGKYGKQIFLGGYPTKKKAFLEAEKIIKETGHDCIYICETCSWEDIDSTKRFDRTFKLDPSVTQKELEEQFDLFINERYEKQKIKEEIDKGIEEQTEKEQDSTTIDHYAHNWFNAIRDKASYEYHKSQMEYYDEMFKSRVEKIRRQYQNSPEYEEQWLNIYKERLEKRKEEDVFEVLKQGHDILKDEILS